MIRFILCVFFIPVLLAGCNGGQCGPNPGCPPGPTIDLAYVQFQFIDHDEKVIDLNGDNIDDIKWILKGNDESEILRLDTLENKGAAFVFRGGDNVYSGKIFQVESSFGATQPIQIDIDSKEIPEDDCFPCPEYFISAIIQNESDTLFLGRLKPDDIIDIKVK